MDAILRYLNENDYTHRGNIAIVISDIFDDNPNIGFDEFSKKIAGIKNDFFRINSLNRGVFAAEVYEVASKTRKESPQLTRGFDSVKDIVTRNLEIGFSQKVYEEERNRIIERFMTVNEPHKRLMHAFNHLLEKVMPYYKNDLHGAKEYSGIDIALEVEDATVGFQIKGRNDDISEEAIRSQSSKAQDWGISGFVLVYGRRRTKKVQTSIQAAYHHFMMLKESGTIYCAILHPELFAELLRVHSVVL